ncbi:neutral zinc metallopeptidase [Bailinhaonella thermotolerans]|uniref:Uncharacterized protein n=1 Tax=Bailinhaonella thermotolerans TaxID=1070861 RepID=A0A3A4AXE9_9ACTN|nr:neutral zinc metallopeptidase [Bailinhaonella thermotolerans]RJL33573.1 hypothetical protein D5H75_12500 [Bailinhaonella thermotolerans]
MLISLVKRSFAVAAGVVALSAPLVVATPATASATSTSTSASTSTSTSASSAVAVAAKPRTNKLHSMGKLPDLGCRAARVEDMDSAVRHLKSIGDCLNRAWGKLFKASGKKFMAAAVKPATSRTKTPCGTLDQKQWVLYCVGGGKASIHLFVDEEDLEYESGLVVGFDLAATYGYHVQEITEIWRTYPEPKGKKAAAEWSRRYELQAQCLGGVFFGSARKTLPVSESAWRQLREEMGYSGDDYWGGDTYGKSKSIRYWMDKGFRSGSPKACNTWKAPSAQVARG